MFVPQPPTGPTSGHEFYRGTSGSGRARTSGPEGLVCERAGATLVYDNSQTPPAYLLEFPGGLMLEIYQSDSFVKETGHNLLAGWRHLALQVDSIESAKAELEAKGVEFRDPVKPAGGGGRVLFFRDIEGNLLHFVQRPDQSALRRFRASAEKQPR